MPNAIDAEISRGHPLFFHAMAAAWIHIFGASHIAMHSFALFISVLFLIAIYEAGIRLFNERVAIMALILVATQVVFFVQSSFVLFEVLVAFLAFVSMYFYVKDKYLLTALCLTALFYTKESGLIMGFVLGVDSIAGLFSKSNDWKTRLYRLLSVSAPCILIMVYFIIQKQVRGWYIFPFYHDLIEYNWNPWFYNFKMNCLRNSFWDHLRYYYFDLLLLLSIIAAIKNKSYKYLVFLIPGIIIYCMIDDKRSRLLAGQLFLVLFFLSIILLLYVLSTLKVFANTRQKRFIVLSAVFIPCFFCFSCMNFFTYRYLLAAFIPLLFFTAVMYDKLIERSYPVLFYPVLALVLAISFFSFKTDEGHGDSDIGAFTGIAIQQDVVDYLEQNNLYDKTIGCDGFLELEHLLNPATGFLHSDKAFKKGSYNLDADYVVFDNLESDPKYLQIKNNPAFYVVHRYEKNGLWDEIYKRK